MRDQRIEICNDCRHSKHVHGRVICSLTECEPAFNITCNEFVANDNEHKRWVMTKTQQIEEIGNAAQRWITIGTSLSCVTIATGAVAMHFRDEFSMLIIGTLAAILLILLTITKYSSLINKRCNEQQELERVKLAHSSKQELEAKSSTKRDMSSEPTSPITMDGIRHIIRQMGYQITTESSGKQEYIEFKDINNAEYIVRYANSRVMFSVGFARESLPNYSEHFVAIAANNTMANILQIRIYQYIGTGVVFEVQNRIKYMNELQETAGEMIEILREAIHLFSYHYQQILEEVAAENNTPSERQQQTKAN